VAKLLLGSKKVMGMQKWYGPPLSPCQVWWDRGLRAICRRKCVLFFCLSVCHALELRSL